MRINFTGIAYDSIGILVFHSEWMRKPVEGYFKSNDQQDD
jgi:hypothetical protein